MTRLKNFIFNRIKAVVFDMDGTLCVPQPWMFPAMRKAIGLNDMTVDILDFITDLPTDEDRAVAERKIHEVEIQAMNEMTPQPGLVDLMKYLTINKFNKGICTRNIQRPVDHLIYKFLPVEYANFDIIITRDFRPTKPNPDPLLHIAEKLKLKPNEIIMVGDSMDDMRCGHDAGCITILLKNHINEYLETEHNDLIDVSIDKLDEIIPLLQNCRGN